MRDRSPRSSSTSDSRPSNRGRALRRASSARSPARYVTADAPMSMRAAASEAAMLAAFDRAQSVVSGRLVGIMAERRARFVPPSHL